MALLYAGTIYTILFWCLFLAWCASELLGPARWQGQGERKRRDGRSSLALGLLAGLGTVLFFLLPVLAPSTTVCKAEIQAVLFFAGTTVVLLGAGLRWAAIKALGTSFTGSVMIQEGQHIVQHGPYRYVRHPSYAGILLICFGFGLMSSNWASCVAITVGMLTGLLYRITVEEKVLQQESSQYREYMQRTKRLIPYIF
jgi:protein-S-isoprenylcysteine O-methyltransferase Ste14